MANAQILVTQRYERR